MRVTFVLARANLSGGVRVVAEHARLLRDRGHEVCVVSMPRRRVTLADRAWAVLRGKRPPRRPSGPPVSHLDGLGLDWRVIDAARPITAADVPDADLIVATWWQTAEWVAAMPASKGVKVNFLQGYEAHGNQPKDRVDAVWRLPMRKIVVSGWLERIAQERFGDGSVILVPNGVDTGRFRFVERGLTGRRVVGAMYSPAPFKRFGLAAEVFERVRAQGGAGGGVFVGFTAGRPRTALPEGAAFELAPSQGRIAEIYGSCDCWLFTSEKEGYGLPLLEAMACGTPVVATPAGAARELTASGGGVLVDSDDAGRIAEAVEEVLGLDDAGWRAMSRAARAEAERHSWDAVGGQMEAALSRVLAEDGGRHG